MSCELRQNLTESEIKWDVANLLVPTKKGWCWHWQFWKSLHEGKKKCPWPCKWYCQVGLVQWPLCKKDTTYVSFAQAELGGTVRGWVEFCSHVSTSRYHVGLWWKLKLEAQWPVWFWVKLRLSMMHVTFELSLARECEGQFGTVSLLNSLLRIIAACCGQATLKVPYALQLHCSIFHGCVILPSLLSWNFNFVFLCTQLWLLNGWKFNWLKVRLTKISTDWKFNCHEHQTMFNSIQTSYQQVMSSQMKS